MSIASSAEILAVAAAVSLAMGIAWLVQRLTRNASWVDAIWTFTAGLAGVTYALLPAAAPTWRRETIAGLALLWSLRLGLHIVARARTGHEDPRYAALRQQWGDRYETKMFAFLQIQALVAWLLALCILLAARNPADHPRLLDLLGAAVFAIALAGEALADAQLARFRADPSHRGQICEAGLWGWSRHPNYFFEWLVWVGFLLLALDFSGRYAWGFAALIGPLMMYWLLVHVSGVPTVEVTMARSRGARFAEYAARVSKFFPLPPAPKGRAP